MGVVAVFYLARSPVSLSLSPECTSQGHLFINSASALANCDRCAFRTAFKRKVGARKVTVEAGTLLSRQRLE